MEHQSHVVTRTFAVGMKSELAIDRIRVSPETHFLLSLSKYTFVHIYSGRVDFFFSLCYWDELLLLYEKGIFVFSKGR